MDPRQSDAEEAFGLLYLGSEIGLDVVFGLVCVVWLVMWNSLRKNSQYYGVRKGDRIELYKKLKKPVRFWEIVLAIILLAVSAGWWLGLRPQIAPWLDDAYSLAQLGRL